MMTERFSLQNEDFSNHLYSHFSQHRLDSNFFDVTFVCEDMKQVSAHKLVLTSSSEYFRDIFQHSKIGFNNLLIFSDLTSDELNNILDYIYQGEVKIFQEKIDKFMSLAKKYKLYGLTQAVISNDEHVDLQAVTSNEVHVDVQAKNVIKKDLIGIVKFEDDIENDVDFKNFPSKEVESFEYILLVDSQYQCSFCGKLSKRKQTAEMHVEIHLNLSYPCSYCEKVFNTKNTLKFHKNTNHRK